MKYIFFILISVSELLAQNVPSFSIKPGQTSVFKVIYTNNLNTTPIFSFVNSVLPASGQSVIDQQLAGAYGVKHFIYELAAPQAGTLSIGGTSTHVYIVPNDTLTVSIGFHQNGTPDFTFSGKYSTINKYYLAQGKALNGVPWQIRSTLVNNTKTLTELKISLDRLLRDEQQFLSKYCINNPLPQWFIYREKQRIVYSDAAERTNGVNYRMFSRMDSISDVPKNFFDFATPQMLNNASASYLDKYISFIKNYIYYAGSQNGEKNYFTFFENWANKNLTGRAWDIFTTQRIDELLNTAPDEGEAMLSKYGSRLKSNKWLSLRKAIYKDSQKLKPGQTAPNFSLINDEDSLTYLKDYRGQVVLLGFWFTGCAPCREEVPFENVLVKYFKDKPVKIVSVCVRSTQSNWVKVSKALNIQTENFYANEAWEKTLLSQYDVTSFPHYVLIDKDGRIIKNHAGRPSTTAKEEIEQLL